METVVANFPRLLRLDETAKALRISRRTVMRLAEAGELRAYRIGGRRLIDARSVTALLKKHEVSHGG